MVGELIFGAFVALLLLCIGAVIGALVWPAPPPPPDDEDNGCDHYHYLPAGVPVLRLKHEGLEVLGAISAGLQALQRELAPILHRDLTVAEMCQFVRNQNALKGYSVALAAGVPVKAYDPTVPHPSESFQALREQYDKLMQGQKAKPTANGSCEAKMPPSRSAAENEPVEACGTVSN